MFTSTIREKMQKENLALLAVRLHLPDGNEWEYLRLISVPVLEEPNMMKFYIEDATIALEIALKETIDAPANT